MSGLTRQRLLTRAAASSLLAVACTGLLGCKSTILVPPRVDLQEYSSIGMIDFGSQTDPALGTLASQTFLQSLQGAQSGVRVLELGSLNRVLETVGSDTLDLGAVRAIGDEYGVELVLTGHLDMSQVKPKLSVSRSLTQMSVRGDVEGTLTAKLQETKSGATVWTRTARGREAVAHANVISRGPADFGANDPEATRTKLTQALAWQATDDFRSHWVRE